MRTVRPGIHGFLRLNRETRVYRVRVVSQPANLPLLYNSRKRAVEYLHRVHLAP